MQTKARPYHSEYSDRLRSEGREEGREEGIELGAVREARAILVRYLEGSPSGITAEQRLRIERCADKQQIESWIAKAFEQGGGDDLFG